MLPLIACGAGLYLGLNFGILVLLPLSLLGAAAIIVSSGASGLNVFDNPGVLILPLISVQAGYIIGLTAREPYGQILARLNIGQSERI